MVFVFLLLSVNSAVSAQAPDTLARARHLRDEHKIKEAISLVKSYHAGHADDFNTNWLYGQLSYYAGNFKKSQKLYEAAIRQAPGNLYLQLDYAGVLVEMGKYSGAKPYVKSYLAYDPSNARALELSRLANWDEKIADTLEMSRRLRDHGKIREASSLSGTYYRHHPDDFNALWLYAQISWLAGHYHRSCALYEKAMQMAPKNLYLQLDYANILVSRGDYPKARPLLETYLAYDTGHTGARLGLANLYYGECRYPEAMAELDRVQRPDKDLSAYLALRNKVILARSPWLDLKEGFLTDDQPLGSLTSRLATGLYLHPLSFLDFAIQVPVFFKSNGAYPAYWLTAENISYISRPRMKIGLEAGILKFPVLSKYSWTGSVDLEKTMLHHLVLSVSGAYKPYFATLSSIDTAVMEGDLAASVAWNDPEKWNGDFTFDFHYFPINKNSVYSFNGWIFAPPVKFSVIELRLGYGFNYSTSTTNCYVPVQSLDEVIATYDPNGSLAGVYDPYFTPDRQQIHSALLSARFWPRKPFSLGLNVNFGFYATAQVPYLYLDKDNAGQFYIDRDFFHKNFLTGSATVFADARISTTFRLHAEYTYYNTLFFISHYVSLGMIVHFRNEKGK
ncbi:MAG TPA: tetratricopeptide repeat protein [Bacteroidales bacterium]|nr:tetratricopeptide repeat protein [Bacteroidales bacterium]